MGIIELILTSIGLGMDAFAVSVCKGLSMKKMSLKKAGIIALYFGGFQALMPLIGYYFANIFKDKVESISNIIAFFLLFFIGVKMIKEAFENDEENCNENIDFKTMIILAIATSIDALAVGISLAILNANIWISIISIGIITFVLSIFGVKIGNVFGDKFEKKAQIAGGIILVLIGIKFLIF